jgi:asparagine synthase (glutamine-hydrolysing)
MCGIAGYSSVASLALDASSVLAAMEHRGPDGQGEFISKDQQSGLYHVRLSIIDVGDGAKQPMHSASGSKALSYNGEIYNFRSIKAGLEAEGLRFSSQSDTEVLLAFLEHKGLDHLSALNGIFAFAYLDKETGDIILVRDRLGIKPLYVSADDRGVFFASELKTLQAMGVTLSDPNPKSIANHLSFLWNPEDSLPSKSVFQLGPGEWMRLSAGKIVERCAWWSSPSLAPKINHERSELDWISQTRSEVRAAVHEQLVADVPVGAFLSGGLDSSSIVAFAREEIANIPCFTIDVGSDVEDGTTDDLDYARKVADHLKVDLNIVKIEPNSMMDDLRFMVRALEEPIADPASLNTYYISKLAREQGIKVLLSGTGGDDLFTGYRRHRALQFARKTDFIPNLLKAPIHSGLKALGQNKSTIRRLTKLMDGLRLSGDDRIIQYFLWSQADQWRPLFTADKQADLVAYDVKRRMQDYLDQADPALDDLDRMLALEQRFFLTEHNLLYTDKMSMATSIEVRVPLLNNNLIDFASTIPNSLKQRGKEGKWIFKKAMESHLPHDVIYRPKTGFLAPVRSWMSGPLYETVKAFLSKDRLQSRGVFDAEAVHSLIEANRAGRVDGSYLILSLICFEMWCEAFLDPFQ